MAIRVRADGTMWCAALTKEKPGDTYIEDDLHYEMSVEKAVIVALPAPQHESHPQWWWMAQAPFPVDVEMD